MDTAFVIEDPTTLDLLAALARHWSVSEEGAIRMLAEREIARLEPPGSRSLCNTGPSTR
jgi:hypothetical protein